MKRAILILSLILLSAAFRAPARAEDFHVDEYTYEELLEIRDEAERMIGEIERRRAAENSDREITLDESEFALYVGSARTLEATVTRRVMSAPEETALVWSSSDARVAKVSGKGVVTGVAAGEAVITCRAKDNEMIEASAAVIVSKPVKRVNLSDESRSLLLKSDAPALARLSLTAAFLPEDARVPDIAWTSSDPSVAMVDDTGAVTALKRGTATITASVTQPGVQGTVTDRCRITVTQAVETITLNETSLTLEAGKSANVKATLAPADAGRKTLSYTTSDASVAVVNAEGRITAKSNGECLITCEAKDGGGASAVSRVTVIRRVASIKLDPRTITAYIGGEDVPLTASLSPASATDGRVQWSSSDPAVAEVSQEGVVRAVGAGKCKILCEALDGSGTSASASVLVPTISVEKTAYTVVSKFGEVIPVTFYGEEVSITFSESASAYFDAVWEERWFSDTTYIVIVPRKAGSGTITVTDMNDPTNKVKITVTIDHAAVYDSVSYPRATYAEILRDPDAYRGSKMSVSGKVLQIFENGAVAVMRVGTGGVGKKDSAFWIECAASLVRDGVTAGCEVTAYGECAGTKDYAAALEAAFTLPALTAEKIVVDRTP